MNKRSKELVEELARVNGKNAGRKYALLYLLREEIEKEINELKVKIVERGLEYEFEDLGIKLTLKNKPSKSEYDIERIHESLEIGKFLKIINVNENKAKSVLSKEEFNKIILGNKSIFQEEGKTVYVQKMKLED